MAQGAVYSYNLTVTLENGASPLSLAEPYSPYSLLLTQNVFRNSSWQTAFVESVCFNGNASQWIMSYDPDGNPQIRILDGDEIGANQSATVSLSFRIEIERPAVSLDVAEAGNLSDIPDDLRREYPLTGIWNLSSLNDPEEVLSLASSIRGDEDNALLVIRRLLLWFEDNMAYSANNTSPQTVWETYSRRSGDCDDQSNLFVLFCRIYGIPAYTAIGPIYTPGAVQDESDQNMVFHTENTGWHGWAMVYIPLRGGGGEWVPVDLTYFQGGYFDKGHIRSASWEQHILGAAVCWKDTALFTEYINFDHITEYARMREAIVGSDCLWVESHRMAASATAQPSEFQPITAALLLAAAIISFVVLRKALKGHRSKSLF